MRERKPITKGELLDKIIGLASMATTSYFKSEDKLKDKFDYHAWRKTLEEHDAMDYVKGSVVEPPSNALAAGKTKYRKVRSKLKELL